MRLLFAILIALLSLFYFLPLAIAFNRKRANTGAIFALNLFLGWSLIGWVNSLSLVLKRRKCCLGLPSKNPQGLNSYIRLKLVTIIGLIG